MSGPRQSPLPQSPQEVSIDAAMMAHALTLARRGLGNTWPNPAVGAVIWRMEQGVPIIVGRGFTQPGGRPHAETQALAMAGRAAEGAAMAVTLEPCSHHGKTPPCCEAVEHAGIARLVSAMEDPDPRVNGRGHIMLRAHGVPVSVGVGARKARAVNLGFIRRVVDGRPLIHLKMAQTQDGFAGVEGSRLMITGRSAQDHVHMLRATHDAVLVGVGTVLADDPDLTCRLMGLEHRSPVRIIFDSALRTPVDSRVVQTARQVPTWIMTGYEASAGAASRLIDAGVVVERVPSHENGQIDILSAVRTLARLGLTRVLCEGGPILAEALAAADLLDSVTLLTGPRQLGESGHDRGNAALGPSLRAQLDDLRAYDTSGQRALGADVIETFTRRN